MENYWKIAKSLFLVLICAVSFFVVAKYTTDPGNNAGTIESIDEKVNTVLKLTAASTVASAAVSTIPGDTATPIAEKLADFSQYFLLVLCVLFAEKYLLSIIGLAAFKVLLPISCLLFIACIWIRKPNSIGSAASKIALLAIALALVIPGSIKVSDMVYDTYETSIETTLNDAETLSVESLDTDAAEEEQEQNLLNKLVDKLTGTASELADKAANILNKFIEALAVMIVTSCLIPILTLVFFLWIIRILTGIEIHVPDRFFLGRGRQEAEE